MTLCGCALCCHHNMSRGTCSLRLHPNFGIKSNCLLLIKCNTIPTSKTSSFDFEKLFLLCVCVRFIAIPSSIRIFVVFYCWFNRKFNGLFTIAILIFHISISTSTTLIQNPSSLLRAFNHVHCIVHSTRSLLPLALCIYLPHTNALFPSHTLELFHGRFSLSFCVFHSLSCSLFCLLSSTAEWQRIRLNNGNGNQNSIHSQQW